MSDDGDVAESAGHRNLETLEYEWSAPPAQPPSPSPKRTFGNQRL
ncbi:hypothetical protein PSAB6_110079 [Paraburkholderia sabiae]|nr:hypothetical protein PSAB6_110079 [Paraburkholderia sabiae]